MDEIGGMTDKQFKAYIRLLLHPIRNVLAKMSDGEAKEELQQLADELRQTLEH